MFIRLNVARTVSTSLSVVKLVKMVLSDYSKLRILSLHWRGYKVSTIVDHLVLEDGIRASMQGVRQFLKRYGNHGTITRKPGSGLPGKLSPSAKMMRRLLHSCNSSWLRTDYTSLWQQSYATGTSLAGSIVGQPTASLYVRQTSKSSWTGRALTYMTALMTLYGAMRQLSSLKVTDALATGRKEKNRAQNPVQNILSKYMFGQELLRRGQVQFAFSKEWMLHCTVKYSNGRSYPLFKRSFHHWVLTDSCKTVIPTTALGLLRSFMAELA